MMTAGVIENFREGWAVLPFVGGHGKPHFFRRIDLSNRYIALCGLQGALATREMLVANGLPHAESHKPFYPGDFMIRRCNLCQRKRQKRVGHQVTDRET